MTMSQTIRKAWAAALLAALVPCNPAFANVDQIAALKRMSVDELLDVEVTSVSRRSEDLRNAAAAVAVVTAEDIRRSGATSLPEALRQVPGLHVARQNSNVWGVSSRGFSSVNSEKLLVLSDTRSIYTPLVSGVQWAVQDYLLADIERVEVIRGPGAALWGSNAVNGVINITTRSARDTHGQYLEAGMGGLEGYRLAARHGGETAGGRHFRVFGQYSDHDATRTLVTTTDDEWRLGHIGFRSDWDGGGADTWTVQGDAYTSEIGQLEPAVVVIGRPGPEGRLQQEASGGNVLARFRRPTGENSELQLRAYYDYTHRKDPTFNDSLHTFDFDLQQRLTPSGKHEVTWGAAFRFMSNRNHGGEIFVLDPSRSDDQLWSGFIQDRIRLTEDVEVTLGTKLEHNDFSGFEVQPSARMAWAITPRQTFWSSISRAVRVPTRFERDVAIDVSDPAVNPVFRLLGNEDFDSERLIAYEAGYRWQPLDNLAFDLALFHNDYDRLASLEVDTPFVDPQSGLTIIPVLNRNLTEGRSRGVELLAEWQPTGTWRLAASYAAVDLELDSAGIDANRGTWLDGSTPRGQFALRSQLTFSERMEFDAQFRHHTRIRRIPVDPTGAGVGAYSSLDLRLGWRISPEWRISLMGQNLLDEEHVEFGGIDTRGALERTAYLKAEWQRE
jgi:iron complex outermembrane recepter protein